MLKCFQTSCYREPSTDPGKYSTDNSINEQVQTQAPYGNHGPVNMANEEHGIHIGASTDGLIQRQWNTGQHLMLDLTEDDQGYFGTFNILVDAGEYAQ